MLLKKEATKLQQDAAVRQKEQEQELLLSQQEEQWQFQLQGRVWVELVVKESQLEVWSLRLLDLMLELNLMWKERVSEWIPLV